nr:NTP transferase domain-containing protein [Candidatus Levybacteria bacterium]
MNKNLGAIILAAGKGTRMKSKGVNKVAMYLASKPMILHTVELLESLNIKDIVVVVGFAKESVINVLEKRAQFAEQKKRLGTAHAVKIALQKLNNKTNDALVLNGDDSAFYSKDIINKLIKKHFDDNSFFTFLTIEKDNPYGLGRVVRNKNGRVKAVIEEKDATSRERSINEVNPGCYVFKVDFLKKYLPLVQKSPITGEYYLTSLIGIGIKHNEKIETLKGGKLIWKGVNTKDELLEAQELITSVPR